MANDTHIKPITSQHQAGSLASGPASSGLPGDFSISRPTPRVRDPVAFNCQSVRRRGASASGLLGSFILISKPIICWLFLAGCMKIGRAVTRCVGAHLQLFIS